MSHGGVRPGAGKPRGRPSRQMLEKQVNAAINGEPIPKTTQRASLILPGDRGSDVFNDPALPLNKAVSPLEFLLLAMSMEELPLGTRLGAAVRALPYTTKKFGLTDEDQRYFPNGNIAPLGFVMACMEDPNMTFNERLQASIAAAPYLHARQDTGKVGVKALRAKEAGTATKRFLEEAKARRKPKPESADAAEPTAQAITLPPLVLPPLRTA